MVVYHFAVVESWLEGRTRWESGRGGKMKRRGTFAAFHVFRINFRAEGGKIAIIFSSPGENDGRAR